jgi:hypothetical protein
MLYEVTESKGTKGEWHVEAINYDVDGEIYVTIFSGPKAQERAKDYAQWKEMTTTPIEKKRRPQLASAST